MKLWVKRWLAMLLSLAMILTLLPMTALAAAAGDGGDSMPDGAAADVWAQDPNTVRGDGSICEAADNGHLRLKIGSGNSNNGDQWTGETEGTGPAVFFSEDMIENLEVDESGSYVVTFKMQPLVEGICFGAYINYKNPANGMFVGYNTGSSNDSGNWFWQCYATGISDNYGNGSGPVPLSTDTVYDVEVSWNPTSKTCTFKIGEAGGELTAVVEDQSYSDVSKAIGEINNFGIKLGKPATGTLSEVEIWDLHYTGQKATYTVSGTVTDGTAAITGATVTMDGRTATTNAEGVYEFTGVLAGEYAVTVAADGYEPASAPVNVKADVTQDFTLIRKTVSTIVPDGVADDWYQDEDTKVAGSVDPVVENGKLKLTAVAANANNCDGSPPPAFFRNPQLDAAIAAAGAAERELSFDMTPDATGDNICLGFGLNYTGRNSEVFIGYNTVGSWFVQYYGGTGKYPSFTGPDLAKGQTYHITIRWTDEKITLFQIDDTVCDMPNDGSFQTVPVADAVGFKCGKDSSGITSMEIANLHYTGQESIDAYAVSGTVRDDKGAVVEGAVVTDGASSTTTNASGVYNLLIQAGTACIITASKDGYADGTVNVSVTDGALSGQDITMKTLPKVTGTITDEQGAKLAYAEVTLTLDGKVVKSAVTNSEGEYEIIGVTDGEYTVTVTAEGYTDYVLEDAVTVAGSDVVVDAALTVKEIPSVELSTGMMTAQVAVNFPQVIKYAIGEKVMYGQTAELNTLRLNGVDVTPIVTSQVAEGNDRIDYVMTVNDGNNNGSNLNVVIKAHIQMGIDGAENTLGFFIDGVEYTNDDRLDNPLETIEIPNHSLVSVSSREENSAFTGGRLASNTISSGDASYKVADKMDQTGTDDFFAGFVYNDEMSASLASNSEYGSGGGGSNNYPVRLSMGPKNGIQTFRLSSTLWYYDRKVSSVNSGAWENRYITKEQSVIGPEANEMPYAKIVITASDENSDGKIDWQDGAIAYRDTIMHKPVNSEGVRDAVSMRISMNFGSQAQNPFLIALDNVKRVALSTDGLGQLILLKGYAGEGHDSNHPDYWDIGTRMGGADDMNTMMEEGNKLGAQFGIHVNASEFYPESKAFSEARVGRDSSGNLRYGWNWIDQGINMNVLYDLASGDRAERFQRLYDLVGDNLTFVYVDVWGNNQHGVGEDGWMTRKLTNEITNETGWRIAHEWSFANPYDSTFQHWTSDYTYGDYGYKGKLNSSVLRFLLNGYKDAFPADFATFGGACNAPLLGGPAMQGFEGWQSDAEYDLSIYNTFNQMVSTKFLQHYDIMQWINADNAVSIPYSVNANGSRSSSANWTPEMQIVLQDADRQHTVVVTRGLDATLDTEASFSLSNEVEYRSRVITLDGKVILKGAPASAGEDNAFPASKATLQYLIPWYWDNEGNTVSSADEKLYHWNATGETTTWELPEGWTNLSSVIVYKLSDQGRDEGAEVAVSGGWITLSGIEANTGYVLVKGRENQGPQFTWSTGLHVEDASFNVDMANSPWTVAGAGTADRVTSNPGISALKLEGEVSVSQVMTGLTAGQKYVTYIGVDNMSDGKAAITITDEDGNVLASNYTMRSIAKNYVGAYSLHNGKGFGVGGVSRFQNMYIFFTPEAGKTYTMTISHEGAGEAYFDDVRTLETEAENFHYDEQGNLTSFTQDFEHVAQGQYPFVVGPVEGVTDNRQHLSELHAPYTQAGWDVKKMDDVLEGNWSLKVNGLVQRNNLVFQTIPQNFRFEPGVTYNISFKYQMGSAGIYQVVVGDGEYQNLSGLRVIELEQGMGKDQDNTCSFTIIGSESGQTWIGIYSTSTAPAYQGATGNAQNFGGYKEIVLDDLVIEVSGIDKAELSTLTSMAAAMNLDDYITVEGYEGTEEEAWTALQTALTDARAALANLDATQEEVDAANAALKTAMANLEKIEVSISGTVTGVNGAPVANAEVTLENSQYIPLGLSVTTDADGKFEFRSTDEVELHVLDYNLKVQAVGYNVVTVPAGELTKTDSVSVCDIALEAENLGAYVNNFDSGDISMMGTLATEGQLPTWEAVDFNGSKALKVTFNATSGETRSVNNVVDKTIQIANGSVSFDVTGLTNTLRLGVTLRATDPSQRIFVGQEDTEGKWFWEWWTTSGGNSWENGSIKEIAVQPGVTRNIRVVLQDTSVQVFVDGIQIYDSVMTGGPTEAGWVGINMRNNAGTSYIIDNLRIIPADEPAEGTYTIEGSVTDEYGSAVAGADVAVLNADGRRVTGTATNAGGLYKTQALEPGAYTVKVSIPGCEPEEKEVVITDSGLTEQNFALKFHIHSMIHVERLEPTVSAEGNIEYWLCVKCGKYFADASGVTEISQADTVIAKLPASETPVPVVPEIVVKPAGPDEEIDDPDTPLGELPFIDVSHDAWYAQPIANVYAKGYMKGTDTMLFSPRMTLNRGMMAQIIHNMAENPAAGANAPFSDVSDRYYAEAVAWGVANGVLKGYSDELFGGEDNVTREQMVVMLYRYAQSLELCKDVDQSVLDGFTDGAEVSGWAKEAVAWAVENGLLQGRGNNDLDPQANITRAEVATVLDRFSKLFLA